MIPKQVKRSRRQLKKASWQSYVNSFHSAVRHDPGGYINLATYWTRTLERCDMRTDRFRSKGFLRAGQRAHRKSMVDRAVWQEAKRLSRKCWPPHGGLKMVAVFRRAMGF